MKTNELSLAERTGFAIRKFWKEYRLPFLSTLIAGLLAYFFAFANKLPNHDDVTYLFGKGETAGSGRWGLDLLRLVIPDISMPWLHGITSLVILAAAICIIIRLFDLRSAISRLLLPALIICFPSQIGTFCYMYTSSSYAVAFLFAVLAVREADKPGVLPAICSAFCTMMMLSIYQAYLSVTSGMMLLLLISDLLRRDGTESGREVVGAFFRRGIRFLALLVVGYVLYQISVRISIFVLGTAYNEYSNELQANAPSLGKGIVLAYRMFVYNLTSRYNMIVVSKFSRLLHALALLVTAVMLTVELLRKRKPVYMLLTLLCLLLLPLCICCMYLAVYWSGIHTLVLYGYILLYVLMFIALERLPGLPAAIGVKLAKDMLCGTAVLVIGINICFANRTFLKLHLAYENAYSLATTLVTQIRLFPGYDDSIPVAFYPSAGSYLKFQEGLGDRDTLKHDLAGAQFQLLTGYTEEDFIRYYLGAQLNVLSWNETELLATDHECRDMPIYPAQGSMKIIDGEVLFIKFSESPENYGQLFDYSNDIFAGTS